MVMTARRRRRIVCGTGIPHDCSRVGSAGERSRSHPRSHEICTLADIMRDGGRDLNASTSIGPPFAHFGRRPRWPCCGSSTPHHDTPQGHRRTFTNQISFFIFQGHPHKLHRIWIGPLTPVRSSTGHGRGTIGCIVIVVIVFGVVLGIILFEIKHHFIIVVVVAAATVVAHQWGWHLLGGKRQGSNSQIALQERHVQQLQDS